MIVPAFPIWRVLETLSVLFLSVSFGITYCAREILRGTRRSRGRVARREGNKSTLLMSSNQNDPFVLAVVWCFGIRFSFVI